MAAQQQLDLLRTRMDSMQVSVNALANSAGAPDGKLQEGFDEISQTQVIMQVNALDTATRLDAVAQWAHGEIVSSETRSNEKHELLCKQVTDAVTNLTQAIKDGACPCPPGCPGKQGCGSPDKTRVPIVPRKQHPRDGDGGGGDSPGGGGGGGDGDEPEGDGWEEYDISSNRDRGYNRDAL